ncbi:ABC transporter ATP-binding protein [Fodinicurvata sediminis]|uniref:ABC transporter ATP-binding protein n=1 Tax=Fodinicurvata sediminis TaxID=1121832 RepID=UPI0003B3DED7|nr:ATP-binding cassette domain-containing protein [Fodinicurvata sediminis]
MSSTAIEIRDLHISFGSNHVLRGVNLDIPKGSSLVVIGGSGSGKSVLLKCILGILQPDSGTIRVNGEEITELYGRALDSFRTRFGMLFQGAALFDSLPVWENVAFYPLHSQGVSRKKAHEVALRFLANVGLDADIAELYPAELSGGMRKRVGLARAIATEPDVIFFDEPTTGLDPIMGDMIDQLIRKCITEYGFTGLTITHDMASVRRISDEVALLYEGRIVWKGPTETLDHPDNPYVEQFVTGQTEGPIQVQF